MRISFFFKRLLLLFIILFNGSHTVHAQVPGSSSIIKGYILDDDGNPVNGSLVELVNISNGNVVSNFTTNANGYYFLMVDFLSIGDTMNGNLTATAGNNFNYSQSN